MLCSDSESTLFILLGGQGVPVHINCTAAINILFRATPIHSMHDGDFSMQRRGNGEMEKDQGSRLQGLY